jgi:hypothetical protein
MLQYLDDQSQLLAKGLFLFVILVIVAVGAWQFMVTKPADAPPAPYQSE